MISVADVKAMLGRHSDLIAQHYGHIAQPFTDAEVKDFLEGKPGAPIRGDYTRSRQISQAVSAIGAYYVDPDENVDPHTKATYKALWQLEQPATCGYCRKPFKFPLMMGNPGHCHKPKCILGAMRDNI